MPNTKNRGQLAPQCMDVFQISPPKEVAIKQLLDNGHKHCLYFGLTGEASPTVGAFEYEWRLMGVWAFFKEEFPFETLPERIQGEVPVLIGTKAYAYGTGMGSNSLFGLLKPEQLKELLFFFERHPVTWSETEKEEFSLLKYCWI